MKFKNKYLQMYLLILSIGSFIIGLFTNEIGLMQLGTILLWISMMCFAVRDMKNRVYFAAFLITFFCFILGKTVSNLIYDFDNYHRFDVSILVHTNKSIYIALLSLFIIFSLIDKYKFRFGDHLINYKSYQNDDTARYYSIQYRSIRKIAKLMYFFTFPINIMISLEKAIFVHNIGYSEFYINYKSRFPYSITKLADVSMVAFFIFLSTMPSKKDVKIPVLFYFVSAFLGLFGGKRSELVVPIIIMILYFYIRNYINTGDSLWLEKKHVMMILISTPFLMAALFSYNSIRFGNVSTVKSIPKMIAGFFDNLGFSVNIISYEKKYELKIPNRIYSFGDTIDYLRENVLTQLIFNFPIYKSQTVDKAIYGNNFSQTITYLYSSKFYLAGRGLGSCYIAEAYHDFGYFGIVLWSGIYSIVLRFMYSFKNKGIAYTTIMFCALKYILIAPRTMASAFISELININTWLVIIVVFIIAKTYRLYIVKGEMSK